MAVKLYCKDGTTQTPIPFFSTLTRESVTSTASVKKYTVTATFTSLLVFLDGLLCEPTTTYTVSGQDVTFVDDLPAGSVISFVSFN